MITTQAVLLEEGDVISIDKLKECITDKNFAIRLSNMKVKRGVIIKIENHSTGLTYTILLNDFSIITLRPKHTLNSYLPTDVYEDHIDFKSFLEKGENNGTKED